MADNSSKITRALTFRVTHTQYNILKNSPRYKGRGNALVRVLLNFYLNGKLNTEEIDKAVEINIEQSNLAVEKGRERKNGNI